MEGLQSQDETLSARTRTDLGACAFSHLSPLVLRKDSLFFGGADKQQQQFEGDQRPEQAP